MPLGKPFTKEEIEALDTLTLAKSMVFCLPGFSGNKYDAQGNFKEKMLPGRVIMAMSEVERAKLKHLNADLLNRIRHPKY